MASTESPRDGGKQARATAPEAKIAARKAGANEAAADAWALMHRILVASRPRLFAIASEFDLAPQQLWALKALEEPRPMHELAKALSCDNSNVTGIVDRLEERGLVRRTSDPSDRRVRLLVLTDEGRRVRGEIAARMTQPPPEIAELSERDAVGLRDILRRALGD